MPAYSTPHPISTTIQLAAGDVRLESSERADTVVDVTPSNPSHEPDVAAAAEAQVEYVDGTLRVIGPKSGGAGLLRKTGSVHVAVKLPTGSNVDARTGLGRVVATGILGFCHIRTGAGDVQLSDAGSIDLVTGIGAISAGHVSGNASCVTGSGAIRVAHIDGTAQIKNSNGDTWLGDVQDALRVRSSNGGVRVDRARGDVKVASANGDLRVGSTERGTVELKTALGRIEVGVVAGTPARLDLHTSFGSVISELDATDRPRSQEATVYVSAQTSAGDIVIRRASAHDQVAAAALHN
jgi:DUF4097 and DUF4098 domain-containing protein YvlB